MNSHPGGIKHTKELLKLSGLNPGAQIIDFGAGGGEAVELMNHLGFKACGIDIEPRSDEIIKENFLSTSFPDSSFDGVLSQCSFYISGNSTKAIKEAHRLLKDNGILMLSDIWFSSPEEQLNRDFEILYQKDITEQWKEYFIESIWSEDVPPCSFKNKCRYITTICRKK